MKGAAARSGRGESRRPPKGAAVEGPGREERESIKRALLAMALAHEIKQPLHSLNLNLELLSKRLGRPQPIAPDIAGPLEALARVVDRVNGCLEAVTTRLVPDTVPAEVRELRPHLIAAIGRAQAAAKKAGVRLSLTAAADLPPLPFHAAQLAVALDALITNAIQASRRGDEVTIRATDNDEEIRIDVQDRGEGMTPEIARHAIEIGFSTRNGDGTGMTLAKFVAYHHLGGFHVESKAGIGTTITLTLPLSGENEDLDDDG